MAEATFTFADLSGFTALTEAHGDEEAADLVGEFCARVSQLLDRHDGEQVKSIGDALMLRSAHASQAIHLGLDIVEEVGHQHGFPSVRVGMHTGPAVERQGDWFGTAVNVAARVSAAAAGSEVLLTGATRRAAGELPDVSLHQRGRQRLRNVAEPVELFAALRAGEHSPEGLPIDPVCRMAVDPEHAAGRLRHGLAEYYLCSLKCIRAFAQAPERYVSQVEGGCSSTE
jgi:adenylate cyclase